jgi:hypothetical protein
MNFSKLLWHLVIISVFAALSYFLTHGIAKGNVLEIIMAMISLGATIVFLWLLPKLHEQPENKSETA